VIFMANETLNSLAKEIKLLREDFRDFRATLMPRNEVEIRIAELNKDITQIKLDIVDHKQISEKAMQQLNLKITRRTWMNHTLTAVFTALMVFAFSYIFNDIVGKK